MIESFVVALREGVEAALVVGLALGYLRKIGRLELGRAVWAGAGAGALVSAALAVLVRLRKFKTEGRVEGVAYLASAIMVAWLVVWMWRHGSSMKRRTETALGRLAGGGRFGVFLFAFLTVLREGIEMVVMLIPETFTTDAVLSAVAVGSGLALAVALGIAIYKGTLRVDLRKFFSVTSVILLIFAFQLLFSGIHEFAEAGDLERLGTGERYMRIVGPLMKHSALFVIAVLVLPFVLMLRKAALPEPAPEAQENPALARKERSRSRAERLARASFAALGILTIFAVGYGYAHTSSGLVLSVPEAVFEEAPLVRIPASIAQDGKLHRLAIKAGKKLLRVLVLKRGEDYVTTLDACTMCFDKGYVQMGDRLICRNCLADLNAETLGEPGGCNPIPLAHRREGPDLVIRWDDLIAHEAMFKGEVRFQVRCEKCGREMDLLEAQGGLGGRFTCQSPGCREGSPGK